MASDSQILALCTMFTEDIFAYYGGKERFGEQAQVWTGRAFVVVITVVAYLIALALKDKAGIFELAIRFAFSGFAALAPMMVAALFWKRSTKWGALAASLWVLVAVLGTVVSAIEPTTAGDRAQAAARPPVQIFPGARRACSCARRANVDRSTAILPVMPMCIGSALADVDRLAADTPPPSQATHRRSYFPEERTRPRSTSS